MYINKWDNLLFCQGVNWDHVCYMFAIREWISQTDNETSTAQSWLVTSAFIVENKEIFTMVSCFCISIEGSHKVLVRKRSQKIHLEKH